MFPANLVQEKEIVVKNFDEAISNLESDYQVTHKDATLDELIINNEGRLACRGEEHLMTEWALENLCGQVGIPRTFARNIPWDLFLHNFDQLKTERNRPLVLAVGREDVVISVIKQGKLPYFPAKSVDVLRKLQEAQAELQVHELRIADRGVEASFIDPRLGELEPQVGDITGIGLRITNSETGFRGLKASSFLLRLVCTNGAVLSNNWANVAWSYDPRMNYRHSLDNFFKQLEQLSLGVSHLRESYRTLIQKKLSVLGLVNLWRSVNRIVGQTDADGILGLPPDERKSLVKATKERRPGDNSHLEETDRSYWEAYNAITERARQYDFLRWRQLERLAGRLLDDTMQKEMQDSDSIDDAHAIAA